MTADPLADPLYADGGLERALCGWIAGASRKELARWFDRVTPDLATDHRHRLILEHACRMFATGEQYDLPSLTMALRVARAGVSAVDLSELASEWQGSSTTIGALLDALEDARRQRLALHIRQRGPGRTGTESLQAIADAAAEGLKARAVATRTIETVVHAEVKALEQDAPRSYLTGLGLFDQVVGGFQPGQLVIVGGRTGAGKSVFSLRMARGMAWATGRPVLYHAMEMSAGELVRRMASDVASVENWRVQRGQYESRHQQEAAGKAMVQVSALPLTFLDRPASFAEHLATYETWLAAHPEAAAIVVDYVGLYSGVRAERRYQELGIIAHTLKTLAQRAGIVVFGVSQLSRSAATDEAPQLHHLRESGDLEQDADVVLLLHALPGDVLEVRIAKHRSGGAGELVPLHYYRPYCRIEDQP